MKHQRSYGLGRLERVVSLRPGRALAVIALGLLLYWSRPAFATPVIRTHQGRISGLSISDEDMYLGIPYAAPPVGKQRWRPPKAPAQFKGVFQATQFGNV